MKIGVEIDKSHQYPKEYLHAELSLQCSYALQLQLSSGQQEGDGCPSDGSHNPRSKELTRKGEGDRLVFSGALSCALTGTILVLLELSHD